MVGAELDLVCLGEPMLEFNQQTRSAAEPQMFIQAHGGDASNVAIAAARQDARVAFLSAVGDDIAGTSFLDLWHREGVEAAAVQTDPDNPTGVYFVQHDESGHRFSYLRRGSAASHYRLDRQGHATIERARFTFASGISLGISDRAADTVFEAFASARRHGRQIAFDTNYRPKLWPAARASAVIQQALRHADIAFPGIEDAHLLLGLSDPDAIVDLCLDMGPRIVVLKMGSAGCLVATPEGRKLVAPFPCRPVDATGAGDTFCGSFLAETARGASIEDAATYANCAAALATMGYGAVPPIPRRRLVLDTLAGKPASLSV
ncbi:sugar kinase [Lichenihabitans psoromatis]|uniref:sugar kinase n=1 Tax=Lichenihabitans psoromatis TaxID=2528642 RepID=UPI0010384098|nr:sugar kinase [Lichenihabitans psoromatis]